MIGTSEDFWVLIVMAITVGWRILNTLDIIGDEE